MSEAYLKFLYTPQAQEIIASNYYRPRNPQVAAKNASSFPKIQLFTIDRNFGGWARAQAGHFNDGGLFDQIFRSDEHTSELQSLMRISSPDVSLKKIHNNEIA